MTNHTDLLRRALYVCEKFIDPDRDDGYVYDLICDLRTAIETGGWLPIETAPKEEVRVLLFFSNPNNSDETYPGFMRCGRVGITGIADGLASHWMPLPPPPNSPNRESE